MLHGAALGLLAGALPVLAVALGALALGACSADRLLGVLPRDAGTAEGGADAARPAAHEECGNGVDDDDNGAIDDGCPCGRDETQPCYLGPRATRGLGTCRDGTQACAVEGDGEYGSWGPCAGGTLPAAEACDGADHDCNGAPDDGCTCTAGASRPCGPGVALGRCRDGVQTCGADERWSECAGAVYPAPERCGDGLDDDCDGPADEGCGCVPEPEACGDGLDNDCDGVIDEGCPAVCFTPPAGSVDLGVHPVPGYGNPLQVAWSGSEVGVAYLGHQSFGSPLSDGRIHLLRVAPDGTVLGDTAPWDLGAPVTLPLNWVVTDLLWTGSEYLILWELTKTTADLHAFMARVSAAGDPAGALVELDPGAGARMPLAAPGPGGFTAVWTRGWDDLAIVAQPFAADLTPRGPAEVLAVPGGAGRGTGAAQGQTHLAVAYEVVRADSSRESRIVFAAPGVAARDVPLPAGPAGQDAGGVVAFGGGRFLVCWGSEVTANRTTMPRCQLFEEDGTAVGGATDLWDSAPNGFPAYAYLGILDLVWAGTHFVLRAERTYEGDPGMGPREWFVELDATGAVMRRIGVDSVGYEYGDTVVGAGCLYTVTQGDLESDTSTIPSTQLGYHFQLRTTCGATCP